MSSLSEMTRNDATQPEDNTAGSIFFIGTATVVIRFAGFTILTDPNFVHMHEQVYLGNGLHATRQTDPAIDIADLPPLDLVLLSHFHGDHFDQVAERELDKSLPIVTNPHAARELRERGFNNLHPIERWETFEQANGGARLRITAMPGRHGPPVVDFALPDVMGSLVEFQTAAGEELLRMYITGDTLLFDDLKEIPARYPDIDIALLHLGGTRVLGILVTMDADQGVKMLQLVQPKVAVPIHYNDYDVFKSPLADFQDAVEAAGWADRVRYLSHGDMLTFSFESGEQGAWPSGASAE
jgi:L-ascorbate metabolism protein UlaG (beta-lactamase superfamily)